MACAIVELKFAFVFIFSRMRSKGFPYMSGGLGVGQCLTVCVRLPAFVLR